MNYLYKLLCAIGIHHWIFGRGWINVDNENSVYHEGFRCSTCGKCKGANYG